MASPSSIGGGGNDDDNDNGETVGNGNNGNGNAISRGEASRIVDYAVEEERIVEMRDPRKGAAFCFDGLSYYLPKKKMG